MKPKRLRCSFCGAEERDCARIIAGPGVFICDDCVTRFLEQLDVEHQKSDLRQFRESFPSPAKIYEYLDQYVIGQSRAKKVISVATYNHYKRVFLLSNDASIEMQKSNILMVGPTGCGKSYLVKALSSFLQVPLSMNDATSLTEAGYVGEDVESILTNLVIAAGYDLEKAQKGICFIDEVDKIAKKQDSASITRDVSGEGVQQALLKIVEGTKANIPPRTGRKHPQQDFLQIDTRNILFIAAGVFEGIDKITQQRVGKSRLGFYTSNTENAKPELASEDLIKFGMIPEFLGRFPVICELEQLSVDELADILEKPKNALLKQYKALFETDNIELTWTREALVEIAKLAEERKTGARGMRSILESIFLDVFFDDATKDNVAKVRLTGESVRANRAELEFRRKAAFS